MATIDTLGPLPTSLMPEHLLRDLTAGQAADLLAYLQMLRSTGCLERHRRDQPRVKLSTSQGESVVALFENKAANTVANLISPMEKDFYAGTPFHTRDPRLHGPGGYLTATRAPAGARARRRASAARERSEPHGSRPVRPRRLASPRAGRLP